MIRYMFGCKCLVILEEIGPLPLAIQQQLLPELQQLLVALHQERRVISADCLGAEEEKGGKEVRRRRQSTERIKASNFFNH